MSHSFGCQGIPIACPSPAIHRALEALCGDDRLKEERRQRLQHLLECFQPAGRCPHAHHREVHIPRRFADHLNKQNIKGVRFVPIRFKPNASVYKDEDLGGINIIVTDRLSFDSVRTGFEIAAALRKLYPNQWQVDRYARLLVNGKMLSMVQQGSDAAALSAEAQKDVDAFKKRREPFLLYK